MRKLVWIKSHYVSSINNTFCVRKEVSPEGLSSFLNCQNELVFFDSFSVWVFSWWGRSGRQWVLLPADDDHSPSARVHEDGSEAWVSVEEEVCGLDWTIFALWTLPFPHCEHQGTGFAFFLLTNSFLSYSLVKQVGFKGSNCQDGHSLALWALKPQVRICSEFI